MDGGAWIGIFGGNTVTIFLWGALALCIAGIIAWIFLPNSGGKYGDPLLEKFKKEQEMGKLPSCVHHCQSMVMRYGDVEELAKYAADKEKVAIYTVTRLS